MALLRKMVSGGMGGGALCMATTHHSIMTGALACGVGEREGVSVWEREGVACLREGRRESGRNGERGREGVWAHSCAGLSI